MKRQSEGKRPQGKGIREGRPLSRRDRDRAAPLPGPVPWAPASLLPFGPALSLWCPALLPSVAWGRNPAVGAEPCKPSRGGGTLQRKGRPVPLGRALSLPSSVPLALCPEGIGTERGAGKGAVPLVQVYIIHSTISCPCPYLLKGTLPLPIPCPCLPRRDGKG